MYETTLIRSFSFVRGEDGSYTLTAMVERVFLDDKTDAVIAVKPDGAVHVSAKIAADNPHVAALISLGTEAHDTQLAAIAEQKREDRERAKTSAAEARKEAERLEALAAGDAAGETVITGQ